MMKYCETLTREELTAFVRHYLYRSRPFLVRVLYFILTTALGVHVLLSADHFMTGIYVLLMTWIMIGLVWATLVEFRQFRIYGQSQYPQEFEFTETSMSVSCANGIQYTVPWRHIKRIYTGKSYTYFATAIGTFWVHKQRFELHLPTIKKLWRAESSRK
jgi:hypothetical protein